MEGYAVARACLAASSAGHKCNYLDLADNTSYVMGFGVLDEEARRRGCLLVTGASTTPAITTVDRQIPADSFQAIYSFIHSFIHSSHSILCCVVYIDDIV
jgi:hypothetical protein